MRRDVNGNVAWAEMGGIAPLAAMGLLFVNDQWLKPAFHNALTGKLSDVAICFLLPLLSSTWLGIVSVWRLPLRTRIAWGSAFAVALFTALELSDLAGESFVRFMAAFGRRAVLTRDLGDLGALAMVPLSAGHALWRTREPGLRLKWRLDLRGALGLCATALASLILMADSPPAVCDQVSPTLVMRAEPGCGKGGLIVLEPDDYDGFVTIHNRPALEDPQRAMSYFPPVRYGSKACPFTLEKGEWSSDGTGICAWAGGVDVNGGAGGGGGTAAGGTGGSGTGGSFMNAGGAGGGTGQSCSSKHYTCRAEVEADGLWYTCRVTGTSTVLCRSHLMVEP